MIFTIVACGQSAENWIPRGHSIGCNDAWKWGKPTNSLVVCNRPADFRGERLQTITHSKPKDFYTHKSNWAYAFPEWKKIELYNWNDGDTGRYFIPGRIYHANTVPFIAICLAVKLGAKDIILWGVDFINHKVFNSESPETVREVNRYMELIKCLEIQGVKVWLGSKGTAFDEKLELWEDTVELNAGQPFQNIKPIKQIEEKSE